MNSSKITLELGEMEKTLSSFNSICAFVRRPVLTSSLRKILSPAFMSRPISRPTSKNFACIGPVDTATTPDIGRFAEAEPSNDANVIANKKRRIGVS